MGVCYRCMEEYPGESRECPHCHAPQSYLPLEPGDLAPGERIGPDGRYWIGWRAWSEGDFVVYYARDVLLSRKRLVYELLPPDLCRRVEGSREPALNPDADPGEFGRRMTALQARAQRMDRVRNDPEIESIVDFFTDNHTAYLVTDDAPGETLRTYQARAGGRLREREAVEIAVHLLRTLERAHCARVLHRAVRPEHWIRNAEGKWTLIGLAQDACALPALTAPPPSHNGAYRAPEQREGLIEGPCTDAYSAALCLFEMLEGRLPNAGETIAPSASPELRERLARGLASRPEERYPSAGAFADALEGKAGETEKASPPRPRMPRWLWAALALALVVAVAAIALLWYLPGQRAARERAERDARAERAVAALPSTVELIDGEPLMLELAVESDRLEELSLAFESGLVSVARTGTQLRLLPLEAGEGALTVTGGAEKKTIRVAVRPTLMALAEERVTLYAGGGTTVPLLMSDGLKPEISVTPEGVAEVVVEGAALRLRALGGAGHAVATLRAGERVATLDVTVLPSPYASYVEGMPQQAEVYEGEDTLLSFDFDGIAPPTLEIACAYGQDYARVTQEGAQLRVRGLQKGKAEYRLSDGQRMFRVEVQIRASLKAVEPMEIAFYADESAKIALTPYSSSLLPELTVSIAPEGVFWYERTGNGLMLHASRPGEATLTVSDGLHSFAVPVRVLQAPRAVDLSAVPAKIELRMSQTMSVPLTLARGDALPTLRFELLEGDDVLRPSQSGSTLLLEGYSVGEGTYRISDELNARVVRAVVREVLGSEVWKQVELIAGQAIILPISTEGGTREGLSWTAEPQNLVSCQWDEEGLRVQAGRTVGECEVSVTDGQSTRRCTLRVVNRLDGVSLPEGNGREPALLGEEQLRAYSDWLCVDMAENLSLRVELQTATGDLQDVTINGSMELVPDGESCAVALTGLRVGGAWLRITLYDEVYTLYVETANRLRAEPAVPDVIYGDETVVIPVDSFDGLAGLEYGDSAGLLTLSPSADNTALCVTAKALGETTLTLGDGENVYSAPVRVAPMLKSVYPDTLSFALVDGTPAEATLTLGFAFNDPGDVALSMTDSGNAGIAWSREGETLTFVASRAARGTLTLTDAAAAARGKSFRVAYEAKATTTRNRITAQPVLPSVLYGDEAIAINFSTSKGNLENVSCNDSAGLLTIVSNADNTALRVTAKALGETTLAVSDGENTYSTPVRVMPRLKSAEPQSLRFTFVDGADAQAALTLGFAFDDPGSVKLEVADSGKADIAWELDGSVLRLQAREASRGTLTLTDDAARAGRGAPIEVEYSSDIQNTVTPPPVTPTPVSVETPKPPQGLSTPVQAVVTGTRMYVLDGDNGHVLEYARDGDIWRAQTVAGQQVGFVSLAQRDGMVYGVDQYGALHLWGDPGPYTNGDFEEGDGTAQLFSVQYEDITDAVITAKAILILIGGESADYSPFEIDSKTTFAYGTGNCSYWLAGDTANENRPVITSGKKLNSKSKLLSNVTAVDLCGTGAAALSDGALWLWGELGDAIKTATGVKNGQNYAQSCKITVDRSAVALSGGSVSLGRENVAAVTRDGQIAIAGANDRGQLGQGTQEGVKGFRLVRLPSGSATRVIVDDGRVFALSSDGCLYGWGDNAGGLLGVEERGVVSEPRLVYRNVRDFSPCVGGSYALVTNDGALVGWDAQSLPAPMILVD